MKQNTKNKLLIMGLIVGMILISGCIFNSPLLEDEQKIGQCLIDTAKNYCDEINESYYGLYIKSQVILPLYPGYFVCLTDKRETDVYPFTREEIKSCLEKIE